DQIMFDMIIKFRRKLPAFLIAVNIILSASLNPSLNAKTLNVVNTSPALIKALSLSRVEIREKFNKKIIPQYCGEKGFYKSCYPGISKSSCVQQMAISYEKCTAKNKIPERVWLGDESDHFG